MPAWRKSVATGRQLSKFAESLSRMLTLRYVKSSGNVAAAPARLSTCVICFSLSASTLNAAWIEPIKSPGATSTGTLSWTMDAWRRRPGDLPMTHSLSYALSTGDTVMAMHLWVSNGRKERL